MPNSRMVKFDAPDLWFRAQNCLRETMASPSKPRNAFLVYARNAFVVYARIVSPAIFLVLLMSTA